MIVALAVITGAALALLYVQERAHNRQQADWMVERRELCSRIQRPELLPVARDMETFEMPEQKADEWAKVGQIEIADDYGLDDDG